MNAKFRDLLSGGDRRSIADSRRVRAWALDSLATVSERKAKLLPGPARSSLPTLTTGNTTFGPTFSEEGLCVASCSFPA